MAEEIEKIYVIPLNKKGFKRAKAAPTAVKRVKSYLTKHMKVEEEKVWIDSSLNQALWSKGKYHIDGKIRVKAVKFEDGVVEAYLPELEFKKSRREILKEEKEKKEPILRKEEKPEEEAVAGAEDYDIAPGADGEVKIKKKKAPKEKEVKPADKEEKKKPKKEAKKEDKKTEKKPKAKSETKKEEKAEPKPEIKKEEKPKPKTEETKKEEKKDKPKPTTQEKPKQDKKPETKPEVKKEDVKTEDKTKKETAKKTEEKDKK